MDPRFWIVVLLLTYSFHRAPLLFPCIYDTCPLIECSNPTRCPGPSLRESLAGLTSHPVHMSSLFLAALASRFVFVCTNLHHPLARGCPTIRYHASHPLLYCSICASILHIPRAPSPLFAVSLSLYLSTALACRVVHSWSSSPLCEECKTSALVVLFVIAPRIPRVVRSGILPCGRGVSCGVWQRSSPAGSSLLSIYFGGLEYSAALRLS